MTRILAVLLMTAVLALCAGPLAHATPRDGATMDCGARLCAGLAGCSATAIAKLQTVAVSPLPGMPGVFAPVARVVGIRIAASRAAPDRLAHALAPRSPPLV